MFVRLDRLSVQGFTTIKSLENFKPGDINVLIGENGSGKSNFIALFRFLSWMTSGGGNLQEYVARCGGAHTLLFDGPETTHEIVVDLGLTTESGDNAYQFRLSYASGDTFIFTEEKYRYISSGFPQNAPSPNWKEMDPGKKESGLFARTEEQDQTAYVLLSLLNKIIVYQFHDTSQTCRMRQKWRVNDGRWLKEDAGNLAAFLFRLKEHESFYYRRIVDTISLNLPFFTDFVLEPDYDSILLRWKERGSDVVLDASQASDGMLRFIALVTLLSQPENDLPEILLLDEPELGLHPYAIRTIADLVHSVSSHSQVFLATQSVNFINHFGPDEIVVVERKDRESTFERLVGVDLDEWLEEYSLGELWEKNVLGGRSAP